MDPRIDPCLLIQLNSVSDGIEDSVSLIFFAEPLVNEHILLLIPIV